MLGDIIDTHVNPWLCLSSHEPKTVGKICAIGNIVFLADLFESSEDKSNPL